MVIETTAQDDPDSQATENHREQLAGLRESCTETLRECVYRAVQLYLEDLGGHESKDIYQLILAEVEPPLITSLLDYTQYNQTRTARLLGVSRSTLRRKMGHYGIGNG